jgi:hypothetical protein
MLAFPCLDAWLTRAMARKEAIALGPEDKAARQRARVRRSKAKAKLKGMIEELRLYESVAKVATGRDVLNLDPVILT